MAVACEAYPELRPLIFAAYEADRITDVQIREQLLDIAAGTYGGSVSAKGRKKPHRYNLESVAWRRAGIELQKDAWRLSYGEFIGVPLDKWPEKAREVQAAAPAKLAALEAEIIGLKADDTPAETASAIDGLRLMIAGDPSRCTTYPLDDARAALAVYLAQEEHAEFLHDQFRQARASFALYLSSAWGLRTDAEGVASLRKATEEALGELTDDLVALGLVRSDGTRDTKVAKRRMIEVCVREEIPVIRTDAHFKGAGKCKALDGTALPDEDDACAEHVCLDADACEASEDDILISYAERTTLAKQLSNDIPALAKGTEFPVHSRYGLAATGRTTSSKPNIQNQSKRPGFRECFVPRPGRVFAQCDYPGLELYTWAQCCKTWFGFSKLGDALNAGMDPHLYLAAHMLGISYEEASSRFDAGDPLVVKTRQQAKPGNFGFAGGMGPPKFIATTRKQLGRAAFEKLGLTLDGENGTRSAKELKEMWKRAWPESEPHFARAAAACGNGRLGHVESLFTKRIRGGTTYCATCNTPFQGLGADCAKNAMWLVAKAQYVQPESPLYNTRTVAFVHDEIILEVDDNERAHDAAYELARLMAEAANVFLPDVPIPLSKLKPLLMRRWSKNAKPVHDTNGRLIPWVG